MEKYYTPTVDEFHVGFEYQVNSLEGIWDNGKEERVWTNTFIDDCIHQLFAETKRLKDESQHVRVKYLDREDIEDLGFKQIREYAYELKSIEIIVTDERFRRPLPEISIYLNKQSIFHGYIKNKSELKKLLKQLKISE